MWSFEGYFKDFEFYLDSSGQPLKKLKCRSSMISFFHVSVCPLLGGDKSE